MARVTLQDIARETGFSKATVSYALRRAPNVPEATRNEIVAAAKRLKYRPDPALSKIASYRWDSRARSSGSQMAYVNLRAKPRKILQSDFFKGLAEEAQTMGYSFDGFLLKNYSSLAELARILYHRGVGGIVFSEASLESHEKAFAEFPWERFVAISCGAGYYRPPIPMIIPDGFSNGQGAVERLVAAGRRRIGIVFCCRDLTQNDDLQLGGMRHAIQSHLSPPERIPELFTDYSDPTPLKDYYKRHRPDAILCNNAAVLHWLQEIGVPVPDAVPLVCLEVGQENNNISGWLTRDREMGRRATRLLHHQLLTNQVGVMERPSLILVPSRWNQGNTFSGI